MIEGVNNVAGYAAGTYGTLSQEAATTYKVIHDVNEGIKIIRGDNFKDPSEEDLKHKF